MSLIEWILWSFIPLKSLETFKQNSLTFLCKISRSLDLLKLGFSLLRIGICSSVYFAKAFRELLRIFKRILQPWLSSQDACQSVNCLILRLLHQYRALENIKLDSGKKKTIYDFGIFTSILLSLISKHMVHIWLYSVAIFTIFI